SAAADTRAEPGFDQRDRRRRGSAEIDGRAEVAEPVSHGDDGEGDAGDPERAARVRDRLRSGFGDAGAKEGTEMKMWAAMAAALLTASAAEVGAGDTSWVEDAGGVVTRDAGGRVTGVDLRGTWVTDSDMRKLARMHDVAVLDLSLTRITDQGMQELKGLPGV